MFAIYPAMPVVIVADLILGDTPILFDFSTAWYSYVVLPPRQKV